MLGNITSLSANGLKDWLIQRVSAVYLLVYTIILLGFCCMHPQLSYSQWHGLFHLIWFQIASMLALFMLLLHAWIGIWTISTDYIKPLALRLPLQIIIAIFLLGQFMWGLMIVWGR